MASAQRRVVVRVRGWHPTTEAVNAIFALMALDAIACVVASDMRLAVALGYLVGQSLKLRHRGSEAHSHHPHE